jgi:hypothetical protein
MILTTEYIKENDLTWKHNAKKNPDWKLILEEFAGYDEGSVTTEYIFKNRHAEEYWSYYKSSNSWDESGDDEESEEPIQVYPTPITKIVYLTAEDIKRLSVG